ncbi:hypothetical protein [Arthrobacter sp. Edens01]|uniref:hypothetical protein n=1 Tax=Arthrobacter sp. Edens01 TaxID=1732020 RepID=UPI0006DB7FF7|nr:hypothetical protein [Arthrobacter sp. Edens01]KPN18480.1 hypothetical protein AO716_11765 [Arthrobacter sp. Edens01]
MKPSNRASRAARQRQARMAARQELAAEQKRRTLRDNVYAGAAGALVLALATALQVFWFSSNPTADDLELLREQSRVPAVTETPAPVPSASPLPSGTP